MSSATVGTQMLKDRYSNWPKLSLSPRGSWQHHLGQYTQHHRLALRQHGGRSGIGTGCPGRWLSCHPWSCSNYVKKWHFGIWFSRHGGVGRMVGADDI